MFDEFSVDYLYDFDFRLEAEYAQNNLIPFGDLVDSTFIKSEEQFRTRKDGKSPVYFQGNPTVFHVGDVINLPYNPVEISTAEAVGLAWAAYASGVSPDS